MSTRVKAWDGAPFPILFTSIWLLAYYQARLAGARADGGALAGLVRSLWYGPRRLRVVKVGSARRTGLLQSVVGSLRGRREAGPLCPLRHVAGHCYAIELPEEFPCDQTGVSLITLLEDGTPLPLPHTTRLKDIVELGAGRYAHIRREVYFSPSDNRSPAEHPRTYTVQESLSGDPNRDALLARLNERRSQYSSALRWGLEKLRVYLEPGLAYGRVTESSSTELRLEQVSLDLNALALGTWSIAELNVGCRSQSAGGALLKLAPRGLSRQGADGPCDGELELEVRRDGRLRLRRFSLASAGRTLCRASLEWADERLQSGTFELAEVPALRRELIRGCGGEDRYQAWLEKSISDLRAGAIGVPWQLGEADGAVIRAALDRESTARDLRLGWSRAGQGLVIRADQTAPAVRE